MQASKIDPNTIYAIRVAKADGYPELDQELVRFQVHTVVTTQRRSHNRKASPHDYTSTVEGRVIDDIVKGVKIRHPWRLDLIPDRILGPYTEHVELLARQEREEEIAKAKREREERLRGELRVALYELIGQPTPEEKGDYSIRATFNDVEINDKMVEPVLDALRRLMHKEAA